MNDKTIRVLSIEDNSADAELIQEKLAEAQRVGWHLPRFEVEHVARLQPALGCLDDGDRFDVVLSDLDLPDSQAGDTVATLREHIPHMPLVVLTGREDESLARKSVRAGVQDYVYKNEATGSLLARTLMYAIERQEARATLEQRVAGRTKELHRTNQELKAEIAERERTEKALRESEEKYRLVELSPDLIAIHLDGEVLCINKAGANLLGFSDPAQVIGKPITKFVTPAHRDISEERMRRMVKERQQSPVYEQTIVRPDGTERDVEVVGIPFAHQDGTAVQIIAHDVTERKQAEDALRESEEQFRLIAETSSDVIFQLDLEGRVTYCSPAVERVLGLTPDEVTGTHLRRYFSAAGLPQAIQNFHRAAAAEQIEMVDAEIVNHAGKLISIEATLAPIIRNGRVVGVQGAARDITERKQMEKTLQKTKRQFQAFLDHSPALVNIFNQEGRYLQVSAATANALGRPQEEIIGKTFSDLLPPDVVATFMTRIARLQETQSPLIVHDQIVMNGEERFFETILFPLSDEDEIGVYASIATDITERKRAEEALRESEALLKATGQMAKVGGWELMADTLEVRWTEQTYRIHEMPVDAEEPPLEEALDFYHLEDQEKLMSAIQRALDAGEPYDLELRFTTAQGRERWARTICQPHVVDGETVKLKGTFQNITEHKRVEEALRESEERFRTIVNALPQFVAYTDKELIYRFVNQTYQEKFGVEPEEVIGKTLPEVIGEDAFEEARPHVEKALRGEQVRYHERYDYAIGGTRDIDGILVPDIAADGEVRGYYAVLTDITPYMEMQEDLRQSNERIRIQHEIDTAILRAQSSEEIAVAALERLHHLIPCRRTSIAEIDPTQQKGRDMIVLIDGEAQTEPEPWHPLTGAGEQLIADIQQGQTYLVDDIAALEALSALEQALVDHGVRSYVSVPLLVRNTPIGTLNLGSDKPNFFQSSHLQILEEVAASLAVALQQAHLLEQTRRDAESKDLLLREVNHRVKNNLNAIIGLLYVERRHAPPEALPAYRPIMDDLTQRITGLSEVHQMLSGSEWAPLNLGELAERIIQTTVQRAQEDVDITPDVSPTSVYVQPAQAQHLALILSELTTNTLKHGVVGRDAVRIAVRVTQQDGVITLIYRNDGPGYAEKVLSLEQHSAGLDIIKRSVRKNLRGELTLRNEGGAVTEIRFKNEE